MRIVNHAVLLLMFFLMAGAAFGETGDITKPDEVVSGPLLTAEVYFHNKQYADAMKFYLEAAKHGNPTAQNRIGEMYKDGLGVTQDYAAAREWFQKAMIAKYPPAHYNLGSLYENGWGVGQDYKVALWLYGQAGSKGYSDGSYRAGYLCENGLGTAKNQKWAVQWYKTAADSGNIEALLALGSICMKGSESGPDYQPALIWYIRAANLGSAVAQNMVGHFYENGLGVQQDVNEAVKWYESAAKNGNKDAETRLKTISQQNLNVAAKFRDAASRGDAEAMYNLARCYDKGTGVAVDYLKALEWYIKAARKKEDTREAHDLELRRKLYAEEFGVLEEIAKEHRQKMTKSVNGEWELALFYEVLSRPMSKNRGDNQHWKYLSGKIGKWIDSHPASITPRIVLAEFHLQEPGVDAEQPPFNLEQKDEGGVSAAEKVLNDALELPEKCPQWFAVMLKIAERKGWEESRLEELFIQALKAEPTFLSYTSIMVKTLAYRWEDQYTGWVPFAEKVEKIFGGHEGIAIFSEISWLALSQTRDASRFMQSNIELWGKIKQGFEYKERISGSNNYDLSRFCYMAVFAKDNAQAQKLFNRLGNNYSKDVFVHESLFDTYKKWAFD